MRCPSCDAAITDTEAAFCSRCGAPLSTAGAERTAELDRPAPAEGARDGGTLKDGDVKARRTGGAADLLRDFGGSVRGSFRGGGWAELSGAAAFGFVALVAVGALLVAAAKLQYEDLGADADPISVLSGIVMAGLGVLRVPISIGDLTVSALPLGGLLLVGAAVAWGTARATRKHGVHELQPTLLHGAKVALPFAVICWIAAIVFRIREDPTPVFAHALPALFLAALWGLLFGVVGALIASAGVRSHLKDMLRTLRGHWRVAYEGLLAGGLMLAATVVLAAVAALLWIIVGLATGRPSGDFGAADGLAAFIYIVLFAPNILAAITAISLGASVEVGAQVTAGGDLVGPLHDISMWDWAGGTVPWFVYLLVLIPLLACLLGGFAARRATKNPRKVIEVLFVTAFVYALGLFEFASLSEARLGAGLVREQGFGRVAPDAGLVFLASLLWAFFAGFVGWRIAESAPATRSDAAAPQAAEPPQPSQDAPPRSDDAPNRSDGGTPPLS